MAAARTTSSARVAFRRQPALVQRRFASTESAKEKASEYSAKAKDAAASFSAKAQDYASAASTRLSPLLGKVSQHTSGLLGAYREPIVYNLQVAKEFAKQVYVKEGLAPPSSLGQVTSNWEYIWSKARDVAWWKTIVENGQWVKIAIYAVEAYGIFTIGEMIGRRKLVGYAKKIHHDH